MDSLANVQCILITMVAPFQDSESIVGVWVGQQGERAAQMGSRRWVLDMDIDMKSKDQIPRLSFRNIDKILRA